jgi:hypothetical protein
MTARRVLFAACLLLLALLALAGVGVCVDAANV